MNYRLLDALMRRYLLRAERHNRLGMCPREKRSGVVFNLAYARERYYQLTHSFRYRGIA